MFPTGTCKLSPFVDSPPAFLRPSNTATTRVWQLFCAAVCCTMAHPTVHTDSCTRPPYTRSRSTTADDPGETSSESFFEIAKPMGRDDFLRITSEVLRSTLLIFAPFGMPSLLRQVFGSEDLFVREYGPRFRYILETVSEKTYQNHGVSESEVAVSLHKYTEEESDPEALAHLSGMSEALRLVYSPPRLLELPGVLTLDELVRVGLSLAHAGAIFTASPRRAPRPLAEVGPPEGEQHSEGGFVDTGAGGMSSRRTEEGCALAQCFAHQAPRASESYAQELRTAALEAEAGENQLVPATAPEHDKVRRAKVALCLQALSSVGKETEDLAEDMQQPHMQALAESYAWQYRARGTNRDGGMCSSGSDSETSIHSNGQGSTAALDAVAAIPFNDNEVFALLCSLEKASTQGEPRTPSDSDSVSDNAKLSGQPHVLREAVATCLHYRLLAEEAIQRSQHLEAATWFDEAFSVGSSLLPSRYLADLQAESARCSFREGNIADALTKAETALSLHKICGAGFFARGQCRRAQGDNEGALVDLVNAFVLQGSALNSSADAGEAQAIEDVSREACKTRAANEFATRARTDVLPADWVIRSFLASYNAEDLYLRSEQDEIEDNNAASDEGKAFRQGLQLMQEGRYIESIDSFSAASETEDANLKSRALEYHGCYLYLKRDMDGALESFRRAALANPENIKCWIKRGSVLCDLGRKEEAFQCFDAAEAIDPKDSDLFLHRGQGHLLANEYREAAADLKRSVELNPKLPISRAALGVALFKVGTIDDQASPSSVAKCIEVMEDALERFPDSTEAALFFAEVLVTLGDFARGLRILKHSASLDPECPLPFVNAGRAYLGMNDVVAARRHLEHARQLDASYSGTYMDMGQLLMQEGLPADALAMYSRGVETSRFPSELQDAMACLDVAKCHVEAQQLLCRHTEY